MPAFGVGSWSVQVRRSHGACPRCACVQGTYRALSQQAPSPRWPTQGPLGGLRRCTSLGRTSSASMPSTGRACSCPLACLCRSRCVGARRCHARMASARASGCLPTVTWQSARAALPPAQVFGHGFLTKDGLKMGKSLGNTLDPKVRATRRGAAHSRQSLPCDKHHGPLRALPRACVPAWQCFQVLVASCTLAPGAARRSLCHCTAPTQCGSTS